MDDVIAVIQTTLASRETADRLARTIVESGRGACVQIQPALNSVYYWQGTCECAEEVLLTIKTGTDEADTLCAWLAQQHPYELPEILVRHERTTAAYAAWVRTEIASRKQADPMQTGPATPDRSRP